MYPFINYLSFFSIIWLLRRSEREKERKTKQSNTTQHNTRPETTFSKEKAALRWDSNPCPTLSRCDALPTDLLRQLSWLSSKSPIQTKAKQCKVSIQTGELKLSMSGAGCNVQVGAVITLCCPCVYRQTESLLGRYPISLLHIQMRVRTLYHCSMGSCTRYLCVKN